MKEDRNRERTEYDFEKTQEFFHDRRSSCIYSTNIDNWYVSIITGQEKQNKVFHRIEGELILT